MESWDDQITVNLPRTPTPKEWGADMFVRLDIDGWLHRRSLKYGWTGCGLESNHRNTSEIRHSYGSHMCPVCFTPFEIHLGAQSDAETKKADAK